MNWPDVPQLWSILSVCEDRWRFTYPNLEIEREVLRMAEWIEANPAKRPKKNWKRFMITWLARNQRSMERANWREEQQRAQRRVDMLVGSYRPITPEQAAENLRNIEEIERRYPDLARHGG